MESIDINELFREGYYCGQEDAQQEVSYGTTKIDNYENYLPKFKLAFDAGYGYGFFDSLNNTTQHQDYGYSYVDTDIPKFTRLIYTIFGGF